MPGVLAAIARRAPAAPSAPAPILRPRWPLLAPLLSAAAGFLFAAAIFAGRPITPVVPQPPISLVPAAPPAPPSPPSPPAPPATPPTPPPGEKRLAPVVATLRAATGALEVKEDAEWQPLASGGAIGEGSWVRTVGRGKGSFVCTDGSEIWLNTGTEVKLACRTVVLTQGEIYTKVAPDPERRFRVSTTDARIEALGTTLDIAHSEATTLTVIEGKALVGEKTVGEGWSCRIVNGVPTEPTRAEKLSILSSWVEELVAVHGTGDEEFQKEIGDILERIGESKASHLDDTEIRALGDRCALPLARYIQSRRSLERPAARERAARILADVAPKASIGDLGRLLDDDDSTVRLEAARGIQRITGDARGYSTETWTGSDYRKAAKEWREALGDPQGPWRAPPPRVDSPRAPEPGKEPAPRQEPPKKVPEDERPRGRGGNS